MARRVNVMMGDEAWGVIEKLPRGARSRAVNEAIVEWARGAARREAVARMDALRERSKPASTDEVVRWIREGREREPS